MDIDSEINAPRYSKLSFVRKLIKKTAQVRYTSMNNPTESEVEIIKKQLVNWNNLNDSTQDYLKYSVMSQNTETHNH